MKILVVDDDKNICYSLRRLLEYNGYEVVLTEEPKAAIRVLQDEPAVELVLMDMNFSHSTDGEEGLTLLKQAKLFRPDVPIILMTAWGSIDLAVRGMRAGAFDFITKPWNADVLMERIRTAKSLTNSKTLSNSPLKGEKPGKLTSSSDCFSAKKASPLRGGLVGSSLSGILSTVARIAPTNAPVLITGESGTGKELVAEAIHRQSKRAGGPFVKVNLGGISSSLFESEMFGHKKGAFTDAQTDRAGRFELANGGTIFLDEIGELSLASQVKLLRVLQDQTYEVLGDSRTRRTDVRVICATNADLRAMVREHTFREDLFYRINLVGIHLPPLRERREDIPMLVEYFLTGACQQAGLPVLKASTDAIAYLQSLPFPGNIRELKNMVERAVLLASPQPSPKGEGERLLTAADFMNEAAQHFTPPLEGTGEASSRSLSSVERCTIAACIARCGGNLSLAAKELGISRGALYRKIEKYGL
ncbi:MAG: sigma-54-dependent Fis family transcriptional regulator [Bacteroidaceae bacterium]|nr:sigma-54-dependent Fis family transcriptional regulator [Bacteroidaceae bacterium]